MLFSAQTPPWPNAIPRGSALCTHRLLCRRPFPPSVSPRVGSLLRRSCAPSVPGLELCKEVREVLSGAELPELRANLLLPEDVALRNLPPLRNAHRRLNFEQDRPIFSALEEVSRADPTPRCKLHVSLWGVVCKAEPGLIAV